MSFALTATSLSGAVAGTTGSVDWTQIAQSAGFPDPTAQPHIQFFNESPCELQLNFSTGEQVMLPAGGWQTLALNAQCTRLTYQVLAVLNAAPIISDLFGTWYAPGEAVPQITTLGNSPIGGSTTTVTTQANELTGVGQTLGVTEVDRGGNPALVPFSGANAQLLLGALDGSGVPVTLWTLDAVNNNTVNAGTLVNSNSNAIANTASNAGIEHGSLSASNTPFIDFHSSGNNIDFDARLIASGGSGSNGQGTLEVNAASFQVDGAVSSVGGQATAGSLGVPVVVAQALAVQVTATTLQTILDYVVPVTGLYRVSVYFRLNNGTSPQNITCSFNWWDGSTVSSQSAFLTTVGASLGVLNAFSLANGAYNTYASPVYAAAATHHIQVLYRDAGGTPNDFVTAIIERMA